MGTVSRDVEQSTARRIPAVKTEVALDRIVAKLLPPPREAGVLSCVTRVVPADCQKVVCRVFHGNRGFIDRTVVVGDGTPRVDSIGTDTNR